MDKATKVQYRDVMAYAKSLADLALQAPVPDVKRMTFKAVNEIRQSFGMHDSEKTEWINESIHDGCRTYDDIAADTGLQKPDVIRLVNDMADQGKVRIGSIAGTSNGSGRRVVYIHLSGDFRKK